MRVRIGNYTGSYPAPTGGGTGVVTADLGVTPRQGMIGSQVTANASGSTTTAARLTKAVFNWGDGSANTTIQEYTVATPARGNQVSPRSFVANHLYDAGLPKNAGSGQYWQYTVTVTVTDNTGSTAQTTKVVTLRAMIWDLTILTSNSDIVTSIKNAATTGSDGLTGARILVQGVGTVYLSSGAFSPKQGMVIWAQSTTGSWDPLSGMVTLSNAPIIDGQWIQTAASPANGNGRAAAGSVTDVTIHGIAFRNYACDVAGTQNNGSNPDDPQGENPCVWGFPGADYWLVEYCEIGPNRGGALKNDGSWSVFQFNYLHDNADGLKAVGQYRGVAQYNWSYHNNPNDIYPSGNIGGGGKTVQSFGATWRYNRWSDNHNFGHWLDNWHAEHVIEDNWIVNNSRHAGIMIEIVSDTAPPTFASGHPIRFNVIIRRNMLNGNGFNTDGENIRSPNINIASSNGVEIYHNIIDGGNQSVTFLTTIRTDNGVDHRVHDVTLRDNWIRFREAGGNGHVDFYSGNWSGGAQTANITNMVIDYNGYYGTQTQEHFGLFTGSTTQTINLCTFAVWQTGDSHNPGGYDAHSLWNPGTYPTTVPIV